MKNAKLLSAVLIASAFCLGAAAEQIENTDLGIAYTVPDEAEEVAPGYYIDEAYLYTVSALPDMTYDDLLAMITEAEQTEDISYREAAFGDFTGIYSLEDDSGFAMTSMFIFEHDGVLIGAAVMSDSVDEETAGAFFDTLSVLDEGTEMPSSVEISFKVGESTLLINGREVTVETPYTVGDGVTLVPVRVITEAFGAKVGWDEETGTVTIDYPDVSVSLRIGSTAAEVNGRFTSLPAAPELSDAGYTMVPLRFLSETFGAEVSYDDETEAILVTLGEADEGGLFTLDHGVKEKYIGSSKYGWAFETLNGLTFYDDGYNTPDEVVLADNSGTMFVVACTEREEDYDFEEDYNELIDSVKETARFLKMEKNTTDYDYDYFEVQILEKGSYSGDMITVTRGYVFDDHIILVLAMIDAKAEGAKDSALAVLDSLTFDFDPMNTYDLGSEELTFKDYTFDDIGISFRAPETFAPAVRGETYSDSRANRVYGGTAEDGYVAVTFYSASDVGDIGKLLENERQAELCGANRELFDSTPVEKTTFLDHEAYTYELKNLTLGGVTLVGRQYAVTVGEYTYFIVATAKNIKTVDEILNSFEITGLDAGKEGFIFCTEDRRDELGGTFSAECGDYTLDVPGVFECDEEASVSNTTYYRSIRLSGSNINEMTKVTFRQLDRGYYGMPLFLGMTAREAALTVFESVYDEETDEILSPLSPVELGGRMWYTATLTYEGSADNIRYYETYYYCLDDGTFLELDYSWNELYNTPETKALGEQLVESMKKNAADKE